ncbi:zinc ribbon domain-containing protein [Anaerolentibacter hominis]|uniref:zinc ribbon domain-containing protein n=1 Tax=Anaerolentibacter hominis TaxID=3079009 RepID=UPI0031B7F7AD
MKSIKPGRGPSMMNGVGSVFAVIFGIIWTGAAVSMGAPVFFTVFGVGFIVLAAVQGLYHWKNATGEDRFSEYDITDETEEKDPLQELFGGKKSKDDVISQKEEHAAGSGSSKFCPYCGSRAEEDFAYCSNCGKKLP